MNTDTARIIVIGAGVNGSLCAVGLYNAGIDVTVLARGKRYEELRDKGIIIENLLNHKRSTTKIPVINTLEPDDVYDYVLVVVRKSQVTDLLPVLAQNRSANVVFMSNNPSGPDEYTRAIGKERVMMGFVFGAGKREGDIVYAVSGGRGFGGTPFGEIDGTITPRLKRLVEIFCRAGLPAKVSLHIKDYLATHAAFVMLFVCPLIKQAGDKHALAQSRADLGLLVDGLRELLDVLPALGYRIIPASFMVIKIIPRFVVVAGLRALVNSDLMEIGMADMSGFWQDDSPVRDEILQWAKEFNTLSKKSDLPIPAIRKLLNLLPMSTTTS